MSVCLLAKSWLKHHHPDLTIKEFHNVLDKTDQLRVRWGNSSKIPFVGYVHMAFQLNHQSTPLIQGSFISKMEWAPFKCLFCTANDSIAKLMVSITSGVSSWYKPCYKIC